MSSNSVEAPISLSGRGAWEQATLDTARPLRILLTNHQLGDPGGTEVNVRDWALGLLQRGHRPLAYAPVLGQTAAALREQSVPVVDDLSRVAEPPDIIHGSHTPTVMEAVVRFPRAPAIQMCQGVGYAMSEPLALPTVLKYIAIDETTRDYLVTEGAVDPGRVAVVHNAVDLRRVPARSRPLPAKPQRALIFTKNESHIPVIAEVCRRHGIVVNALGRGVGRVVPDPEKELADYDLIFATARSALEAIAAGAATVVVDGRGLAGMATRDNVDWLRRHNFGLRSLRREVSVDNIANEIAKYDSGEAAALSRDLRPVIALDAQLDVFERIYREAIAENAARLPSELDLLQSLVPELHKWLPRFPGTVWSWQFEKAELLNRIAQLDASLARERAVGFRGPLARLAHAIGRAAGAVSRRLR